ncbi:hypothetical protein LTR53_000914 [Teratosphaeriaceae sp. CCFEE 6253]|nr:hypothetical protein LTR53_000914 [Teratosphaeriaceae sp. CCFEE 6253]
MHRSTAAFVALLGAATAYRCESFFTNVTVTTLSYQPAFPPFENHYQSVTFLNNLAVRNSSKTVSPFKGAVNITETFSISADYCTPARPRHTSPVDVQVLTHGLGFDKSYWDFGGASSQYNYIRTATAAGFATLSYDRIGNGHSSIVDPYAIQQLQIELAVLEALTTKLREGMLASCVPKPTGKVLHVGHSYGSILSHALVAAAPALSDGIVLTGYSTSAAFQGEFLINTGFHLARENQPERFGNCSTGSLTWPDELANQFSFLTYPYFDPAVLAYTEAHKYPFSLGEILTGSVMSFNASAFTGPVLMISGDTDLIFCGSDCVGILEQAAPLFAAAEPFETYIQRNTGHGMNLHFNATGTYEVIQTFLKSNA